MQNSMVVFTFSVLDQKQSFWANLVQKFKFASLSWNLVPTITHKIFGTNSKTSKLYLRLTVKHRKVSKYYEKICSLIRIWKIQWRYSRFLFLDGKHPFWANLVQKIKIVNLHSNLVPWLMWICRIRWSYLLFLF